MPSILVVATTEPRQRLVNTLRQAGYTVEEADSGESTLKSVGSIPPELILMSIVLPESNGLEIAARLRRKGNGEFPRVILLGSVPPIGMDDEPLTSLASGYLNIDASSDDLLAMVRSQLTPNNQKNCNSSPSY